MEVWVSAMGPERVLPSSEDDLGEEERPVDDVLQPGGAVWSGGEDGGEIDGEEEEEEVASGEYHYQPLNQEPDGPNSMEQQQQQEEEEEETGGVDGSSHAQQLQQVQQRIEVMGLHLPEAPPPDSEEEDPEGAAALRSRSSIPMDADHVELVKKTMAAVALPSLGVPPWAQEISDDQWKDMVQHTLQTRQSAAALRLHRRGNVPGP